MKNQEYRFNQPYVDHSKMYVFLPLLYQLFCRHLPHFFDGLIEFEEVLKLFHIPFYLHDLLQKKGKARFYIEILGIQRNKESDTFY